MAMDGSNSAPVQVYTPFYAKLQEWILRQQEFEATESQAAPLTKVQRKLLSELEQTLMFESEPGPEPKLGDFNWVSTLHEYRATHRRSLSDDIVFTEESIPGPSKTVRFRYQVRIDEAGTSFPNGVQPSFVRKKDAKQYAAKCAIEWLRANNLMPTNGVRFPKTQMHPPLREASAPSSPTVTAVAMAAAKRQKISPLSPTISSTPAVAVNGNTANNAVKAESPSSSISSMALPASTEPQTPAFSRGDTSPFDADQRSAGYEVAELCQKLGGQPPEYKLTQDPEHGQFWSGHAEFGQLPFGPLAHIPPCRVETVLGKKAAKQKIAELLVPHLNEAWDARQARIDKHIRELAAKSKTT